MRGVAALVVLAMHVQPMLGFSLFPGGYLAVDFFFGLSGLVVAHAYRARLEHSMSFTHFLMIRIFRLWPLYAVACLFALVIFAIRCGLGRIPVTDVLSVLPNLLMIPDNTSTYLFALNLVAWSLFWEFAVNIIFALSIRIRSPNRLYVGFVACGLAVIIAAGAVFGNLDLGVEWSTVWGGAARAIFSFFLGVLIQNIALAFKIRLPSIAILPLIGALLISFILPVHGVFRSGLDLAAVTILYPVIIFLAASMNTPKSMDRVFSFLGAISYAVYVINIPLFAAFRMANDFLKIEPSPILYVSFIAVTLCVSWWLDRFFDQPMRRYLTNRFLRPAPNPHATPATV